MIVMKKLPFLLVVILIACSVRAQIDWARYSQTYEQGSGSPQIIAAIPAGNDAFWPTNSGSVLKNRFQADPDFMKSRPENFVVLTTFDHENAQFFVKGAGARNAQYEYRILKDGKETVASWSVLTVPAHDSVKAMSTIRDLMYIGGFKADFGH
jgi:hypothetical protein